MAKARAGFNITEIKQDGAEFTACNRDDTVTYAVEAKSRHRHGVLGFGLTTKAVQSQETVGIEDLLRSAFSKRTQHALIVFVDLNLKPNDAGHIDASQVVEINNTINNLGKEFDNTKDAFAATLVVFTNYPQYYLEPNDENSVSGCWHYVRPENPKIGKISDTEFNDIEKALNIYHEIPDFDDFA